MFAPRLLILVSALAACSDTAKQDISEPRFDITDDKDDSPRKPSKGVDVRITQLAEGKFGATRGYISHEIRLEGGTVDIDLTGNGEQLDTILYVFGPKKPNGQYPAQALAFNDDFDYPSNLGSHIVLDVPAAGSYRIVVSTYDNYIAYPKNVSVAGYRLMVKCQNPAFGACGPAISDEGGACWADDDCLALDGRPLHCEGEVTCAPGTQCFFTREGRCVESYAWMTIAPVQCSAPWSDTEGDDELTKVIAYYKAQGIRIDEIGVLASPDPLITCAACGCPRGDEIIVKVPTLAAADLAQLGWTYSASHPGAQAIAPKQCGSNPWQTAPSSSVYEELELVDAWVAANAATTVKRGFVMPAEPRIVCAACSCDRGDRLVVFAPDEHTHGIFAALGFAAIYVP